MPLPRAAGQGRWFKGRKGAWLLLAAAALGALPFLGWSLYVGQMERALRQEAFPGGEPHGSSGMLRSLLGRGIGARLVPRAALSCLRNERRDRWGNQPVLFGALDVLDDSDDAIRALAALLRKPGLEPRTQRKAQLALLTRLSSLSDRAGGYPKHAAYYEPQHQARLARISRGLGDLILPLASGDDGDDIELRCLALPVLAGMQHEATLPLAASAAKAFPRRLQKAAFRAAWTFASVKGELSDPVLNELLLAALKGADDELRRRILIDFSENPRLQVPESLALELMEDRHSEIPGLALRRLNSLDAEKARERAWAWLMRGDPSRWAHATFFLAEQAKGLSAAKVLELCDSPHLSLRFSALEIALKQGQRWHGDTPEALSYQAVPERLRNDSDTRLAVVARWHAGDRSCAEQGAKAREELLQACLDQGPKPAEATPLLTPDEIRKTRETNTREAWIALQRTLLARARNLFLPPQEHAADPLRRDLYALLIDRYAASPEGPVVIHVPTAREKAGLVSLPNAPLILTRAEGQTLQEDVGYAGPIIDFSEIFYDAKRQEAWVQISFQFAPRWGHGLGVILKKRDGIWIVEAEREMWIS